MKKAYLLQGVANGMLGPFKYILENPLYKGITYYKENNVKNKDLALF